MLNRLYIRDFVLVEALNLEFSEGFTVLTGETGAGKSLLMDALSLLLGARSDASSVRDGALRADLIAEFTLPHASRAAQWLCGGTVPQTSHTHETLELRRTIDRNGKSRSWINRAPATAQQLRALGERLVGLHSQHAHHALHRPEAQRSLLDDYAGATHLAAEVATAYHDWQQALKAHTDALHHAQARAEERMLLETQIDELEKQGISPTEWQQLLTDQRHLSSASARQEIAQRGLALLLDDETALIPSLTHYIQGLSEFTALDHTLQESSDLLESARIQLQEAGYALRHTSTHAELDPAALAQVEQRMADAHALARKYQTRPESLSEKLQGLQQRQCTLQAQADATRTQAAVDATQSRYMQCAHTLSAIRQRGAMMLSAATTATLAKLAMQTSEIQIALPPLSTPTAGGLESVEYQIRHHGTAPKSLARIASGGELSRISLALQVAMAGVSSVPTLIFDEVDVGIGGRVADVVGQLFRSLGDSGSVRQVLSITHLPQVAAHAHHHWRVLKNANPGMPMRSDIAVLNTTERIEEIARMLGGAALTETTRQHAQELLGNCQVVMGEE